MNEELLKDVAEKLSGIVRIESKLDTLREYVDGELQSANERITELEERNANLEEKIQAIEKKYSKEQVLADLYSKRLNLIVHGIPGSTAWETRENSLEIVKSFLKNDLKIEKDIDIIDAHRLKTSSSNDTRKLRSSIPKHKPLIFKLANQFDKDRIWTNLKNLKPSSPMTKQSIYVTNHLPAAMIKQKSSLYKKFKEARSLKKKVNWKIDFTSDDYCLYIEGNEL